MTAVPEPTLLERRITDALGTVREARVEFEHNPNTNSHGLLIACQRRFDQLMDQWIAEHTAEGMVTA